MELAGAVIGFVLITKSSDLVRGDLASWRIGNLLKSRHQDSSRKMGF
jgi:hypothetical protein